VSALINMKIQINLKNQEKIINNC